MCIELIKSGLLPARIFIWGPVIAGARLSEHVSPEQAQRLIDIVGQTTGKTTLAD